jgi:ATP-dependent RNA helicase SUPV3L1/SUV3
VPCSLLTGEQLIPVDGARITAATIEMFDPRRSGACVIVDEAHMLTDPQRGWAWTRAILEARAAQIHIIAAPFVGPLVTRLVEAAGMQLEKVTHARLTPLKVSRTPWQMSRLPPRTLLIAFSRAAVLGLKTELEKRHGRRVSVVYGVLPPEVRLKQAERFASGENEICVATDAVGMGLNLPADNVCFYETQKFDGHAWRSLNANEIRQIGGRAGRFGLSAFGRVGALTEEDLELVTKAFRQPMREQTYAHVAPTPEALALLPGPLAARLGQWAQLQDIPPRWKRLLRTADLSQQIGLAQQLSVEDVQRLGQEDALTLINAPVYPETEAYWRDCVRAILKETPLPLPRPPRLEKIDGAEDLKRYEQAIRAADCYLWLSQREPFRPFALHAETARARRAHWSAQVDAAFQRRIDTGRRCPACGRPLALKHRHKLCQRCYRNGAAARRFDLWEAGE